MAERQSPPADRKIISEPDVYAVLEEVWAENLRVDSRGYVQDVEILMGDWGFHLSDVKAKVHLWQGEGDANTPVTWARSMAEELPNCEAVFFPEEGHFALFTRWKEILQRLAVG